MREITLGLVLCMGLVACSPAPLLSNHRWSRSNSGGEQPLSEADLSAADTFSVGQEKVFRSSRKIFGADVEGAGWQAVGDPSGRLISAVVTEPDRIQIKDSREIDHLVADQGRLVRNFQRSFGRTKLGEADSTVVIAQVGSIWRPAIRLRYLLPNESAVREFLISSTGQIWRDRNIELRAVDGVATVFRGSPRKSILSEQVLHNLVGDGTLTTPLVRALSEIGNSPIQPGNDFRYNPDQQQFDDVQAFYFADQHVRWFRDQMQVQLPYRLDVRVHAGGPAPKSIMYYFNHQIVLGDGDGVLYRGIPRDPSIVKHEAGHAFVELLAGLGSEGEAGIYNEAFADLFYALADNNPYMGSYAYQNQPYTRSLVNSLRADRDLGKSKYNDSLVISSTFWDLKDVLGTLKTARLAVSFLTRLGPGGHVVEFPSVMKEVTSELSSEDRVAIQQVLDKRGWPGSK